MKRIVVSLILCVITVTIFAQKNANNKRSAYTQIFQNGTEAQKDSIIKIIVYDGKTNTSEADLQFYYNILNNNNLITEAAAVQKRAIKLYPKGSMARGRDIDKFYKLESLKEKEKLYNDILKKYPVKNYPGDGIVYDYITSALARDLIRDGQKEKTLKYLDNMQEKFWRAQGYIPVASVLLQQGDTVSAMPLIEKSIEDALEFIKSDVQDNKAKFAAVGYPGYVQMYADVLLARGEYEEALAYLDEARSVVPESAMKLWSSYAKALQMAGRHLEAFNYYTSLYKAGQFNYYEPLEKLYIKLNNGKRTGLEEFIQQQQQELKENTRKHLDEIVINKETPSFNLRNLKGEIVDSKTLSGKIVVLDFWATWCQPCKRSFPGMQKVVTKYKDNPDVVFLFIDTWEKDEDYEQKVKDFIDKNNYTFNVLFDDANNGEIARKFGVSAIPAKFIIDKKGRTRFFLAGSSPYEDYVLMEMTEMIEFVKDDVKL